DQNKAKRKRGRPRVKEPKSNELPPESKKILQAKTPEEYIKLCMNSKLTQGQKTALTRIWLKDKDFTSADIIHVRNRHPYWISQKKKGSRERNLQRREMFSKGNNRRRWDEKDCRFLVENNDLRDFELAQQLNRSIASIQSKRRQINALVTLYQKDGKRLKKDVIIRELQKSETSLIKAVKEKVGKRPRDGKKKL
ncbi:MAG: hypothetical protein KDK38_02815, partial [Leptospiraceae bacterium]|nr:hypothetical protein [Leptospiraceae bacterium]